MHFASFSQARVIRASALCVAFALYGVPGAAQSFSSASSVGDPEARRTALYKEGVALANAGHWEDAAARFREVVAIRSAPPALFTLGQAEEHVGRYVSAKRDYARAQADAFAAGSRDVADAAQRALVAVDVHVAHLTLKPSPPDGATATLDGAPVAIGDSVEVDPGEHRVVITAPNRPPWSSSVRVSAGERQDVAAELAASSHDVAPPQASTGPSRSFPVGPVVLGGAGVAAVVIGIIVRQAGQSSFDTATSMCPPSGCDSETVVNQGNSARSQILAGDVVLGVGIAAVAGAATWWLVSPKASAPVAAGFEVIPTPSGLRASLHASF